jgi:hypothetical protein
LLELVAACSAVVKQLSHSGCGGALVARRAADDESRYQNRSGIFMIFIL